MSEVDPTRPRILIADDIGSGIEDAKKEGVTRGVTAKHWKKKTDPPPNHVVFRNFRLYQF